MSIPPPFQGLLHRFGGDFARVQRLVDPSVMALIYLGVAAHAESAIPSQWHRMAAVIVFLLSLIMLGQAKLYRSYRTQSLLVLLRRLTTGWLLVVLSLTLVLFLSKQSVGFSRGDSLMFAALGWVDLVLVHLGGRKWMRLYRETGGNSRKVIFWGSAAAAARFEHAILSNSYMGIRLAAAVDACAEDALQRLRLLLDQANADQVVISEPLSSNKELFFLLSRYCLPVRYLPDWAEASMRFEVTRVGDQILVDLWNSSEREISLLIKRLADLFAAPILLLLLSPVMLILAVFVKLTSPGPILFWQQRAGLDGRIFRIVKFRTMYENCDLSNASLRQVQVGDPRVTPFGRWLRAWSLDELPQLWNVLRGQMSLVGPRPHALEHNDLFASSIPGYMQRHLLKPGLTGLAQVQGLRGETPNLDDMRQRIDADLLYQRQWSLALDLKILLLTLLHWRSGRAY